MLTFFLRSKLGVCRFRFEGNKGQTMRGERQGSTPIKYAVKQEDFIGGERIEAFGLDVTLIVC
ncbi:hypothetical protein BHU16_09175 [Tannerella sp. oral taxon 808]|nr:hypothetical protein BHU16_11015 [Tannerella sp. oral taxon 808]PNE24062.1 hypothetical protein BHU16_09175 [Tannerella sp. oral taxon 808]